MRRLLPHLPLALLIGVLAASGAFAQEMQEMAMKAAAPTAAKVEEKMDPAAAECSRSICKQFTFTLEGSSRISSIIIIKFYDPPLINLQQHILFFCITFTSSKLFEGHRWNF